MDMDMDIDNSPDEHKELIAEVKLENIVGYNYLFEVYSSGVVRISSIGLGFDEGRLEDGMFITRQIREIREQVEIILSQCKMDELLNDVNNFINEDMENIVLNYFIPAFNFCITATYREMVRQMDGNFVLPPVYNDFLQTAMAQQLMATLREISPISIIFICQNP